MAASCLYNIFIYPLQLLFETVFDLFYSIGENPGVAILGVSLVMNFLALPLYRRADAYAAAERRKRAEMKQWTDHIRRTFRGDERYMMLNAWYKEQGYHPMMSLRGSISLLLQIPFFTAAYRFLSRLTLLKGAEFWFLKDLGVEDGLLVVGTVTINVLPIVMTVINLISGFIYTKGQPFRSRISIYALAAIFLVLLYHAPSGLVFYWTCNNLFSLAKNLVLRGVYGSDPPLAEEDASQRKGVAAAFFSSQLVLTLLAGLVIPATVIASDPSSFTDIHHFVDPNTSLILTLSLGAGMFLFWGGVIFYLLPKKHREKAAIASACIAVFCLINYLAFATPFGTLSASMVYEEEVTFGVKTILVGVLVLLLVVAGLILVWDVIRKWFTWVMFALCLTLVTFAAVKAAETERTLEEEGYMEAAAEDLPEQPITLSRTGKNVVVMMLDRSIDSFIPWLFSERPELKEAFTGFTWYPDTLSFGGHTNLAAPALFGGYEYTPKRINERAEEPLKEKHDEALLVMPTLFSEAGMDVTVVDPPYAGYRENPDLSIYDGLDRVNAYNLCGAYETKESAEIRASQQERRTRQLFTYSLFRISPDLWRNAIYDDGDYHDPEYYPYVDPVLVDYAPVLKKLPEITEISDKAAGSFLLFQNGTTHGPSSLQLPEYELSLHADNSAYDTSYRINDDGDVLVTENYRVERHYEVDMMALTDVAAWLNLLKEEGLYDNTRIIIVSDHGYDIGLLHTIETGEKTYDTTFLNPLLMVKDFGAEGELVVSEDFMTNADVPELAMEGVIENPLNPFTGREMTMEAKGVDQIVTTSKHFWITDRNTFDTTDGHWMAVDGTVLDNSGWRDLGEGEK